MAKRIIKKKPVGSTGRTRKPVEKLPEKDLLAKKRVEELLGDIEKPKAAVIEEEEVHVDMLQKANQEQGEGWVENQLDALTNENTKLKEDYNKLFAEYQKVADGKAPQATGDVSDMQKKVEKIFFEMDDVFTGAKFGTPYHEAKLKPMLEKFMQTFPFLLEALRRRKASIVR